MLQGHEYDILTSGFGTSGIISSNSCDRDDFVALNGFIDTDAGAPTSNFAGLTSDLGRSFFTHYFNLDDLCNSHIGLCILGRMSTNLMS